MSIQLKDFDAWVRSILDLPGYQAADSSPNGLQVSRRNQEIRKIAFAVDACMETFQRAVEGGADLLFTHHGLFWGREQVLTGTHYERVRYLVEKDLALYAVHLPLDAHPEFGNNAGMAAALQLEDREPFGKHKGVYIGLKGLLPAKLKLEEVIRILFTEKQNLISILPFGPARIRSVAIVSGGGTYDVDAAIDQGIDLFITGDANHVVYHRCMEAGINVLFAGHYLTETWGPRLMLKKFMADTALSGFFVDVPTGL